MKKIVSVFLVVSLLAPVKVSASEMYYDEALSTYEGATLDDVMSNGDVSIYQSADYDTIILQKPSGVTRTAGENLSKINSKTYETDANISYDEATPDKYVFTDAAIDSNGTVYDLEMTVNSVTELAGADNPHVTIHSDARISHEDVDVNISLKVLDKCGDAIHRPLTMIFEDMDMMTSIGFNLDEIDKVYAPYTTETSTDVTNPSSYFNYDTLSEDLIEMNMNPHISEDMKSERLRYDITDGKFTVYDAWNTMHKFDAVEHPELFDIVNLDGFNDIKYLKSSGDIYNLQNTPEQNFSVVFNQNGITLDISQNVEAYGGNTAEENNLYLASPGFIPNHC